MWKIVTFLSALVSIASFISIFFDIKGKIPISKGRFILLISALAILVVCIKANYSISLNNADNKGNNNDTVFKTTYPVEDKEPDESEIQQQSEDIPVIEDPPYYVERLIFNPISFSPITESDCSISSIDIEQIYGEISAEDGCCEYEFIPEIDGIYRFEFSEVPDGTDLRLSITNAGDEIIKSGYDLDSGDGLTVYLHARDYYHIKVEYYENTGTFILNIGKKKPVTDVSHATKVFDSVQYLDQENDYSFTPYVSGVYRFEFADVPDGTDFKLQVFNSGWEQINSNYDLDNGDGITTSLDAQHTYYIRVTEYENLGSYTLNIGHKKAIEDVSLFSSVSDSIQFTDQEVDYSFIPAVSGSYRFDFSNVPDGTDLKLIVFNSGWEQIKNDYDLDNGDGITVTLVANNIYYIRVAQYEKTGPFTLNIGHKKEISDISPYKVISDSIQYIDQENDYMFSPSSAGDYRFEFSNISDAAELKLQIFNSGWEQIEYDYGLDSGDGLTITLDVGNIYYIRVVQYRELGNYTLRIINL